MFKAQVWSGLLQQGPPWYNRLFTITFILATVVLVLAVGVTYLWYKQTDFTLWPDSDESADAMTDEEQVMELISAANGQLSQQELVTETNWSEAKVSRVTSRMVEEEDIEKIRIGRRNVLRTPTESQNQVTKDDS
jgi:uncharacterized membrane protein